MSSKVSPSQCDSRKNIDKGLIPVQYHHSIYKRQVESVQDEEISGLKGSRIIRHREVTWFFKGVNSVPGHA